MTSSRAPTLFALRKATRTGTSTLVLARPGVVGELGMCGRSLYGNREVSRSTNSERTRAALVRIGEARSRSPAVHFPKTGSEERKPGFRLE